MLNPLKFASVTGTPNTGVAGNVGTGTNTVTITASQYQALRRIVGLRFNAIKIGTEYALLSRNCQPPMTENQIHVVDWNTLGQIFGEELFSDAA